MNARAPLYQRLPEIYRVRDAESTPAGQLQAYLGVIDSAFATLHTNIDALYHDLFIDSCDDWVVPYLADLLGTTHLSGDPWTLRADVARTVHHRRRKGTLGAVESLVFTLSGWAVHAVEMRERLAWHQHLNHQRPDAGGVPPLTLVRSISAAARGGTVTLRDPALLAFAHQPFDPFGHVCDVKPPSTGISGYNLPNLALFLWRLEDYTVPVSAPRFHSIVTLAGGGGLASRAVRFELHPLGEPTVLFNSHRFHADDEPPNLTHPDALPAPMPAQRLTTGRPAGNPAAYVAVETYAAGAPPAAPGADAVGLTLHLPQANFPAVPWIFRGANLCAWEAGLNPPLAANEIAIDPRGRVVFGLAGAGVGPRANALRDGLYVSATHGFSGPTGAHPLARDAAPDEWLGATPIVRAVSFHANANGLRDALADLHSLTQPLIIEIADSMTHELDLDAVSGRGDELGLRTLRPSRSLWIRAASGQRPVIRLARPLAFRPADVLSAGGAAQAAILTVKLEGLYLTRGAAFGAADALIQRAALHRLEIEECTLDPGGFVDLGGTRRPLRYALRLANDYGFADAPDGPEVKAFDQTPEIVLTRSIAGPLAVDDGYRLFVSGSIIDAGSGVAEAVPALAIHAAGGDPETAWGPELTLGLPADAQLSRRTARIPLELRGGLTCFGRARVERATGSGGLFVHRLQVHDTLYGCLRFCCFSGAADRLPQHHACVFRPGARLRFSAESFGMPAYGQLALDCDRRILEQGPGNDEMGAFGYLRNAHRWKNIGIRLREYTPVGVRPLLIAIT